ncbi:amidohydrolase 2 [Aulographum hederae CBS 113979]|uniref:Amidohydrolase 2 n=1 Tax=Aulographum hederae CBS 113979 TaxID=1176131 RepID=A0A6G1GPP6_9PEZI|nr:amidohydrolase 2 [Aulographum hederae CBS 113979]
MSAWRGDLIDVHSHLYPQSYLSLLAARTSPPYIAPTPTKPSQHLLYNRPGAGKPITPLLHDITSKQAFMRTHGIDVSILSLGNPWLDFMPPESATEACRTINTDFDRICRETDDQRFYFFAVLPLSARPEEIISTIRDLRMLPQCKGVVIGTSGLGGGLDDREFLPLFRALAEETLPVFIHPNYGLPFEVYGPRAAAGEYGQVCQVALGFPLETTICITRMFLAGVFDSVPDLKVILSHAGGALPFLAGRVESCCSHDRALQSQGKLAKERKTIWQVMRKNLWLDGVVFSSIAMKAAVEAAGIERLLFGTDHPLFGVPLDGGDLWSSVSSCQDAVREAVPEKVVSSIMGANAQKLLRIDWS